MNKRGGSNKRGGWTNLKIMINVEGRFLCGGWDKFCEKNKRGSTFIRQERVSTLVPSSYDFTDSI